MQAISNILLPLQLMNALILAQNQCWYVTRTHCNPCMFFSTKFVQETTLITIYLHMQKLTAIIPVTQ